MIQWAIQLLLHRAPVLTFGVVCATRLVAIDRLKCLSRKLLANRLIDEIDVTIAAVMAAKVTVLGILEATCVRSSLTLSCSLILASDFRLRQLWL